MITKKLGKRIKELRVQTGLSQEKFDLKIESDGLGISLSKLFKRMDE